MQLPVGDHLGKEKKVKHKKGAHLLEVVGQQLAANVQPPHSAANPFALDEGDTVGETEARVNDQAAALVGKLFPVLKGVWMFYWQKTKPMFKYLVAGKVRCMGSEDSGEAVLLEEHFREPLLDGSEVEEGLGEDQGGGVRLDVEALLAKDIIPDGLLVIPINQVAFLCWQQVEQGG